MTRVRKTSLAVLLAAVLAITGLSITGLATGTALAQPVQRPQQHERIEPVP